MNDILEQLGTKRENFPLLLTDAPRWMSLSGRTLKELYSSLMHVTCVAHLLHNCDMRVRAYFKNTDDAEAKIKAAAIKNKDRKKDFYEADLPPPPDPVITRCATWLRATLFRESFLLLVLLSTTGQVAVSQLAEQKPSMSIIWCQA